MSLEGGLGLGHSQVIGLLLNFLLGALSLCLGKHRLLLGLQGLVPGLLGSVPVPLYLGQFLLQIGNLLFGDLQLFLSLEQVPCLILSLLLSTGQARFDAIPSPSHLLQIFPCLQEVGLRVFEGLRSVQVLVTLEVQGPDLVVSHLFQSVSGLNGLPIETSEM